MSKHEWKRINFVHSNMNRTIHKSDKDVRRQLKVIDGDIKTILDIGACIGAFSLSYANRIKRKDLQIYSFEPVKHNYKKLVANVRNNNFQNNIRTFNFGLGSEEKDVIMGVPKSRSHEENDGLYAVDNGSEELRKTIKSKVIKLSDFLKNNDIREIDIIKMDAEGSEMDILQDISYILPNVKYIHIEVNTHFESSRDIVSFLKDNGFSFIKSVWKINQLWVNNIYKEIKK